MANSCHLLAEPLKSRGRSQRGSRRRARRRHGLARRRGGRGGSGSSILLRAAARPTVGPAPALRCSPQAPAPLPPLAARDTGDDVARCSLPSGGPRN